MCNSDCSICFEAVTGYKFVNIFRNIFPDNEALSLNMSSLSIDEDVLEEGNDTNSKRAI
ncbi:hypothetical protein PF008_g10081 [Phytophthora fragariae]|uniref:Uncharacterized protein n=1 Tax=Phytophthora fragariae TaxID=53985 RepID=A0A6G0RWE3_9STRA|nr:hypothetical protein PF008_g10081 [Phytophthora fragariae]